MWVAITLASLTVIVLGGWLFAKWRLRKKGWKAGGGLWLAIFLIYVGVWTYIRWPFLKTPETKIKTEEIHNKETKDTISWNRA